MIDAIRHLEIFNPDRFSKRVDIIGCGATGSRIALTLAKLGVLNIHAWDFDVVAEHNIANQEFNQEDIGKFKTEALRDLIIKATGETITIHTEAVEGGEQLGEVVFLLTDTMSSRKIIYEESLKLKPHVQVVIETRMSTDNGRIYCFNPCSPTETQSWEKTLCSDEEVKEVSACGSPISIGPTADVISGIAVWQFLRWFQLNSEGGEDEPDNEIIFFLRPLTVLSSKFKGTYKLASNQ